MPNTDSTEWFVPEKFCFGVPACSEDHKAVVRHRLSRAVVQFQGGCVLLHTIPLFHRFRRRQSAKLHVEDGGGLKRAHFKPADQFGAVGRLVAWA
jgi:hypothetical protein